jgi:hypothetical protein
MTSDLPNLVDLVIAILIISFDSIGFRPKSRIRTEIFPTTMGCSTFELKLALWFCNGAAGINHYKVNVSLPLIGD